jgi:hypothetical protein
MAECGKMRRRLRPCAIAAVFALAPVLSRPAPAQSVAEKIQDAQKVVEAVRGRKFTHTVESATIGGTKLKAVLSQKLREGLPVEPDEYFRTLAAVGAIPPADLPGLFDRLLEFYRGQVLAFYDPADGKFYVSTDAAEKNGFGGSEESLIYTHELTHALQDQHLGLDRRMRAMRNESDAGLALEALLEGEATAVMIDAATRDMPEAAGLLDDALAPLLTASLADLDPSAGNVPEFFTQQLLFPYSEGTAYIRARKKREGWSAIDRLWTKPPSSTSEILHPGETFEPARRLLPDPPPSPSGYRLLYTDTLGEWTLRFVLRRAGHESAETLASSWRGDRFAFYRKGDRIAYVGKVRAVDPAAAIRLMDGWKKVDPSARGVVRGSDLVVFTGFDSPPV